MSRERILKTEGGSALLTTGGSASEFTDKVLVINRVAKKTKGGDKKGFAALVAVGNRNGRVGLGYGKAADLRSAIAKATSRAKRKVFTVPIKDFTLPRRIEIKEGAAHLLLMPAPHGAGLIVGGVVRHILKLAGVSDASGKILGSNNPMANAQLTISALKELKDAPTPSELAFNRKRKDAPPAAELAFKRK